MNPVVPVDAAASSAEPAMSGYAAAAHSNTANDVSNHNFVFFMLDWHFSLKRRRKHHPASPEFFPRPLLFSLSEVTTTMKLRRPPVLLVLPLLLAACAGTPAPKPAPTPPKAAPIPAVQVVAETVRDPHTFAHPEEVSVEHLALGSAAAPACACATPPAPPGSCWTPGTSTSARSRWTAARPRRISSSATR